MSWLISKLLKSTNQKVCNNKVESFIIIIIIIMVCRMVQVSLGINKTRINTKYIPLIIVIVIKIT